MGLKAGISTLIRSMGLIYQADRIRYFLLRLIKQRVNKDFVAKHPGVPFPPDYLMYEAFRLNYEKYYNGGYTASIMLREMLAAFIELKERKILDWGCGPGRIIRHLPEVIGNECEFFGSDLNRFSVEWCRTNLPGITFIKNTSTPALPFENDFMDVIYGISVFTHLSESMHYDWYNELHRILKPGGILLFTTQGSNFRTKLTKAELKIFDRGKTVVRSNAMEGHRTFSAFQPDAFVTDLCIKAEIVCHISPRPEKGSALPQDIWIIRKNI